MIYIYIYIYIIDIYHWNKCISKEIPNTVSIQSLCIFSQHPTVLRYGICSGEQMYGICSGEQNLSRNSSVWPVKKCLEPHRHHLKMAPQTPCDKPDTVEAGGSLVGGRAQEIKGVVRHSHLTRMRGFLSTHVSIQLPSLLQASAWLLYGRGSVHFWGGEFHTLQ